MITGDSVGTLIVFILSILCVIHPISIPIPRNTIKLPLNLTTAPILAITTLWVAQWLGPRVHDGIVGTDGVKPYSILILFFSLAYMAITLDITGVLQAAAFWVSNRGGSNGWKPYFYFYLAVILSGTAFLVYNTKAAELNPISWLMSEFAAANTTSMVLFVGNPTNVVICEGFSVNNAALTAYTILPFLACNFVCFLAHGAQFHDEKYFCRRLNVTADLDVRPVLLDPLGAGVGSILLGGSCLVIIIFILVGTVWNNLCSVVRLGTGRRSVHADQVPVRLTRVVSPPPRADDAAPPAFLRSMYAIQTIPDAAPGMPPSTHIPADVLRGIQLHAVVPSRTPVDDAIVPLILRLRTRSEDADTRDRLRVLGFEADVVQVERFHTSPSASNAARYPVPLAHEQPPAKRLRSPHPIAALFERSIVSRPPVRKHVVRERSIVPAAASKEFKVRGSDARGPGVPFEEGWLRMEVSVPVSPGLEDDDGARGKRVTAESPFLDVRHEMRVKLRVGFEQPGEAALLSDDMTFVVPLDFVRLARAPLASTCRHAHATSSRPLPHPPMGAARRPSRAHSVAALHAQPPPPPLPAHRQLFHENGDLKDEWHVPLYREKDAVPGAPSSFGCESSAGFESSSAGSESPTSPGMPLTPPGLERARAVRRDDKYGQSFLRFDEDDMEPAADDVVGEEDVQYGIAF